MQLTDAGSKATVRMLFTVGLVEAEALSFAQVCTAEAVIWWLQLE